MTDTRPGITTSIHPIMAAVTERIVRRSAPTRQAYLDLIARERENGARRPRLSCGNLAHAFAASGDDKAAIRAGRAMNIAIVTAYNDMLSAHQPLDAIRRQIKLAAREAGATAQVAGGVPAMCDGVTQGQPGMELSLFSRDVIAMSTGVALSHDMFDGRADAGHLRQDRARPADRRAGFGHLPMIFVPAGPMPSGLANKEKAAGAPALRRGQGQPRGTAGGRGGQLSRGGHLHLLRHRQLQPDADGGDGAASARRRLRQSGNAACARP